VNQFRFIVLRITENIVICLLRWLKFVTNMRELRRSEDEVVGKYSSCGIKLVTFSVSHLSIDENERWYLSAGVSGYKFNFNSINCFYPFCPSHFLVKLLLEHWKSLTMKAHPVAQFSPAFSKNFYLLLGHFSFSYYSHFLWKQRNILFSSKITKLNPDSFLNSLWSSGSWWRAGIRRISWLFQSCYKGAEK